TAIVLKTRPTPPAEVTPSTTRSASSRWLRLHGIVPVHVVAIPTMGPASRDGSIPIARKCARAGARDAPLTRSPCTSAGCVDGLEHEPLVDFAGQPAHADGADARIAVEHGDSAEEECEERVEARALDGVVASLLGELAGRTG